MENNTPESTSYTLDKFAKVVENCAHWDSESNEKLYFDAIHKMETAEGFFQAHGKKLSTNCIYDDLDPICLEFAEAQIEYSNAVQEIRKRIKFITSKKELNILREKSNSCAHTFYEKIGKIMSKYGILDTLVSRSNSAFKKVGADFMCCNSTMVLDDFSQCKKDPMPIICAKISFAVNKIVKYWDDIEYGDLLEDDSHKIKENSDKRLKYLSKLKTDYLKKFMGIVLCTYGDDNIAALIQSRKKQYHQLFDPYFKDLSFEKDILKIHAYELRKDYFYSAKSEMIGHFIASIAPDKKNSFREITSYKELKEWGLCKDGHGHLLLGINLYQYPMPITVHIPKSSFKDILRNILDTRSNGTFSPKIVVPEYRSLTGKEGIFPTNVLFKATSMQREKLEKACKHNPNNPYLQFFYSNTRQTNKEQFKKPEYHDFDEFIK